MLEAVLGLILLLVVNASVAPLVLATHNPNHQAPQVTICHATASATNPYNQQTVDEAAVDGVGQGSGQGADHNRDDHQDGEDIIPPGAWDADGRNWDAAGQAIWNNNCNAVQASPSPSPSPSPSASASASPSSEPSAQPSPSAGTTLSVDGPRCDSTTFSVSILYTIGGSPVAGLPVTFTYQGMTLNAATDGVGIAQVAFGFLSPGTVTASAPGFTDASGDIKAADLCPVLVLDPGKAQGETRGQVLGVSTMAFTGVAENVFEVIFALGATLVGLGVRGYGKKSQ